MFAEKTQVQVEATDETCENNNNPATTVAAVCCSSVWGEINAAPDRVNTRVGFLLSSELRLSVWRHLITTAVVGGGHECHTVELLAAAITSPQKVTRRRAGRKSCRARDSFSRFATFAQKPLVRVDRGPERGRRDCHNSSSC